MAYDGDYWGQFEPVPVEQPRFPPRDTSGFPAPGEAAERGFPGPVLPPNPGPIVPVPGSGAPPAPGAPAGGGGRTAFRDAWFAYAQQKPPNVTYVDWLAQFVAANPQYGVTIGGSKKNKIYGPGGEYWAQAVRSAGINGGVGTAWDEETGGGAGESGGMGGDGYGDWTKPYGERYNLPTQEELEAMPGYQAGLKAYTKGIETSAASKGTLLTGGTLQRLGQAGADYTAQSYGQLAGLQAGAFNTNYNIFRNNQTDPFNKYYSLATLGKP